VPGETVRRAKNYLARLDRFNAGGSSQADLFAAATPGVATPAEPVPASPEQAALSAALAALDPDAMTPRDALAALYELRKLAEK
jgi:DNA mismatch repair protein MutS